MAGTFSHLKLRDEVGVVALEVHLGLGRLVLRVARKLHF